MKQIHIRGLFFTIVIAGVLWAPSFLLAGQTVRQLSLQQTIEAAIEANLRLQQSREDVAAARANKNASITNFFPTLNARYSYLHRNKPTTQSLLTPTGQLIDVTINPDEEYNFVTSFTQPVFTGFALINQYKIADMGLNAAKITENIRRQDVILDAKNAYFSLLKAQKLQMVALDTVRQIAAQKEVAENMYQVGMSPLNDLLQSQVQLANARQRLISAKNNMEVAKSQFNTLLRRPVNAPVQIEDILDYTPFVHDIDYCLAQADTQRLELQVADLEIQIAQKEYRLSQRNYYPSINLTGT